MTLYPGQPGQSPQHPLGFGAPIPGSDRVLPQEHVLQAPVTLRARLALSTNAKGQGQIAEAMQEFEASASEAEITAAIARLLAAAIAALRTQGIALAGERPTERGE